MSSLILRVATRLLAGLILVFAVYLLLRGHNAPGGGFVAALVAGTGFALVAISEGPAAVRRALRVDPERLAMGGLGLAIVCGLAGVMAGRPFLTGLWRVVQADASTTLAVGTPLFFDIGVFLAVLGTLLTLILALEEN
ncbi:MAG: MnhB domain-containing protein [Desulfobacterales bacterium]